MPCGGLSVGRGVNYEGDTDMNRSAVLSVVLLVIGSMPGSAGATGEETYNSGCVACHGTGVAGAPRVGDKAAWTDRIAQGESVLYENAIKGFQGASGVMPAKGGFTNLTDEQVKSAVDFMISASQ